MNPIVTPSLEGKGESAAVLPLTSARPAEKVGPLAETEYADGVLPSADDLGAFKEQFEREGYAIVRGLFSPEEVEEIREVFRKLHAEGVTGFYQPGAPADGVQDSQDPLYRYPRVMHPHRFNQRARDYMLHPKVRARLEALFGTEPVATQSMFYFKPPGSRGQAMHQDQFYLLVEPGTCMAAWTAIDDCDAENGGMMVVPQTHHSDVVCQPAQADRTKSFTTHFVPVPKDKRPVLPEMKAGDTLFFNGSVIHGSGSNRSKDRFRRAFICHYASDDLQKISRH